MATAISRSILLALALALALVSVCCVSGAPAKETSDNGQDNSILKPVPVTGVGWPRYDIDLDGAEPSKEQKEGPKQMAETDRDSSEQSEQPGRLAIRRLWVYSDPMQAPMTRYYNNPWATFGLTGGDTGGAPFISLRPASTIQVSPIRSLFADMFNSRDETPDSTSSSNSDNNEKESESRPTPTTSNSDNNNSDAGTSIMKNIDPHQLMLDLLQQALSMRHNSFGDHFGGHFGGPSSSPFSPSSSNSDEKPEMKTETKEDIVEIDGEKYLRKTVVSKHVGENMMFMTKKYILTPLNATTLSDDKSTNQTTTTPVSTVDKRQEGSSTTTTAEKPTEPASTSVDSKSKPADVQPIFSHSTTTTTTTPTPMANDPKDTASSTTITTTTASSPTGPKDAIEKEGEVVVDQPEVNSSSATRERVIKRKGSDHED